LYGELRKHPGELLKRLAEQKESPIEEGHLLPDHVQMLISIPPTHSVSQAAAFIEGRSAIHMAVHGERKKSFVRKHFSARGVLVSAVGSEESVVREYIRT
jgi:putative transposase